MIYSKFKYHRTLHSTYNWRGLINTGIFPNEILNLKSLEKL